MKNELIQAKNVSRNYILKNGGLNWEPYHLEIFQNHSGRPKC